MKILVTGSSGLVGSALVPFLTSGGHTVVRLLRPPATPAAGVCLWDPSRGHIDAAGLERLDGVVHLAGDSIASGRWNAARKESIRKSRSAGTQLLAETLAGLKQPPRVLVSASAIGWYGSRGDQVLGEDSNPGADFLAEVCRDWEAATEPARKAGIRVVTLRMGFILSPRGGGLARMLTPFRMGAGGRIGDGRQWLSWIAIDDVIGAVHHALVTDSLSGPVNVVAPGPVTNAEFTRTLGRVLHRPTLFPMPAFAARAAFGEMADALLLASQRVEPRRLLAAKYAFRHPTLEDALRHLLGRTAK